MDTTNGKLVCRIVDISRTGALVQCPWPLHPGTTGRVYFPVAPRGARIGIDALVVRLARPGFAALSFRQVREGDRERLDRLIQQRARLAGFGG